MGQQRPNILFLISDTHGAWATGCYGSQVARTPSIDRLAAEGIVFNRAYAQNPLCVPSRQSFLTGQYSFQCGVLQNDTPMPRLYTMAHHLRQAGYETAALGKMHFIPDTESSLGKECRHGFAKRIDYEEFWWNLRNERGFPPVEGLADDRWRLVHLEVAQHRLQNAMLKPPDRGPEGPWGTLPHDDHQEAMVLRAWQECLAGRTGHHLHQLHYRPHLRLQSRAAANPHAAGNHHTASSTAARRVGYRGARQGGLWRWPEWLQFRNGCRLVTPHGMPEIPILL